MESESVRFMGVGFISPAQPPGGFLNTLEPVDQRTCLGIHSSYCKRVEEEIIANKILEKKTFEFVEDHEFDDPFYEQNSKKRKCNSPCLVSENDVQPQHRKYTEHCKLMTQVYLHEPHILRVSVYRKFLLQYQYLYNMQAIPELMNVLILPCFSRDIRRESKLSPSIPKFIPSISLQSQNVQAICDEKQSFHGIGNLQAVYDMLFRKLPDCIMQYHESKIFNKPDMGTFVVTPFTFFGTLSMPIEENDTTDGNGSISTSTDSDISESDFDGTEEMVGKDVKNSLAKQNLMLCSVDGIKRKAPKLKPVGIIANGLTILQFHDDTNLIVWKSDITYITHVNGANSSMSHETLWNYLWSPPK